MTQERLIRLVCWTCGVELDFTREGVGFCDGCIARMEEIHGAEHDPRTCLCCLARLGRSDDAAAVVAALLGPESEPR